MKIALAQINPIVGDLSGNADLILEACKKAVYEEVDLVVFPEMVVSGYPPQDLLDSPSFVSAVEVSIARLVQSFPRDLGVIIGAPIANTSETGKRVYNTALFYENEQLIARVDKCLLPTYDVFDEYRYFEEGEDQKVVEWRGNRIGLHICEDMWNAGSEELFHLYDRNPIKELEDQGVDFFLNISASPFALGKIEQREGIIKEITTDTGKPFICVNQVGANTEIVFDGTSCVYSGEGERVLSCASFDADFQVYNLGQAEKIDDRRDSEIADIYDALILGVRDYYNKTGFFDGVLLGLSGGIDSAVTCAIAALALGGERVVGITMPSVYSSEGSVKDSEDLALNLGVKLLQIPIAEIVSSFEKGLSDHFAETKSGVAEENLQARTRGVLLMAYSNKFNKLLLTTGNKSEMAVGYATLYGDMNGGLAVLSDVLKTKVFELAEYINERAGRDLIPRNTIDKPPSAELRPDQKDSDSLPDYDVLDTILEAYVEDHLDVEEIVAETALDRDLVSKIVRQVDQNEYKRRQAAPGIRVTDKAFGFGRRVPIVMRWNRQVPEIKEVKSEEFGVRSGDVADGSGDDHNSSILSNSAKL